MQVMEAHEQLELAELENELETLEAENKRIKPPKKGSTSHLKTPHRLGRVNDGCYPVKVLG